MTAKFVLDRLRLVLLASAMLYAGFITVDGCGGALRWSADLHLRWVEQQYVLRGVNPFDVYDAWRTESARRPDAKHEDVPLIDPTLGIPNPSYPPWTYLFGALFLWSPDPFVAKQCYVAVSVLFLIFMAWWILRGSGLRLEYAALLLIATFAADGIYSTFCFGQLGTLTMGALLVSYWFDQCERPMLAGLFLGIALLKPTLSGPFVLAFLVKQRWSALAVAASYNLLASVYTWTLTGTDPLTMLLQMETSGTDWQVTYYTSTHDTISLLSRLGLERRPALRLSVSLMTALTLLVMWACRRGSMMALFAIAALVSRVWVSHYHYDDVILLFVLFGLAETLQQGFSIMALVLTLLLSVALWLPQFHWSGLVAGVSSWGNGEYDGLQLLCPIAATIVVVVHAYRRSRAALAETEVAQPRG